MFRELSRALLGSRPRALFLVLAFVHFAQVGPIRIFRCLRSIPSALPRMIVGALLIVVALPTLFLVIVIRQAGCFQMKPPAFMLVPKRLGAFHCDLPALQPVAGIAKGCSRSLYGAASPMRVIDGMANKRGCRHDTYCDTHRKSSARCGNLRWSSRQDKNKLFFIR